MEVLRKIATAVGIHTQGKSAEQLSTLIMEAATKRPPAPAPNVIDPDALSKHFEEGRFTDCTIRVKLSDGRPAKRAKKKRRKGSGAAAANNVHVIKAHAVILASRSAYFERAMGGDWRESKDRSFEVEVADETEYVTFRRLIKLCYGSTFIKEGDRDLDVSELVRLIHVANAFECMDAVKECATALTNGELDWEGAVQCLELTEMLKGVEGMAGLAKKAGAVIAEEVGPLHELFTPVKDDEDEDDGDDVLGGLRLSEKVKALSLTLFEALLSSKGLQLKTANEAFWLLLSWVETQSEESEEGKQALFTRMAKHLSFPAMDPGYILLLVSEHPRVISAGLQHTVTRASLIRSNLARRTAGVIEQTDKDGIVYLPVAFAGGKPEWTFNVTFTTAEAAATEPGERCSKIVGLAAGLPWFVRLKRTQATESEGEKLRVSTMCSFPFDWMSYEDGSGFYYQYKLEVGVGAPRETSYTKRRWSSGLNAWGKTFAAWEEVFKEGSKWLVNGELCVRLTVTTANDQGP